MKLFIPGVKEEEVEKSYQKLKELALSEVGESRGILDSRIYKLRYHRGGDPEELSVVVGGEDPIHGGTVLCIFESDGFYVYLSEAFNGLKIRTSRVGKLELTLLNRIEYFD